MARPLKKGIDNFPLDSDFYNDERVRKLIRACGPNAVSILLCLLCNIYKDKGYYILWNADLPFVIADQVGVTEGSVSEVAKKAVQVGIFDQDMFAEFAVMTSQSIQKNYFEAVRKRKGDLSRLPYLLVKVRQKKATEQPTAQRSASPVLTPVVQTTSATICGNKDNAQCLQRFFATGNRANLEQLMVNLSLRPNDFDKLKSVAQVVVNEWNTTGTSHDDYSDWARHLISLVRIKLQIKADKHKSAAPQQTEEIRTQQRMEAEQRHAQNATYAVTPEQISRLRDLSKQGNQQAAYILNGTVRLTKKEIDEFLKNTA